MALGYTSGGTVAVVDTPATVVSITPSTLGPTNATSLTYSVVFSKNVYDVAPSDFQLAATGTAAGTITSVSAASGSSITVTVASISGNGTLQLNLPDGGGIQDIAGAAVPAFTSGGVTTFEDTPPTITSDTPSTPGPTTDNSLTFTVAFSEMVYNVAASDFQLTTGGSAIGTITTVSAASGTSFTVGVAGIDGSGTLRLDLESGSTITDGIGNVATAYTSGGTVTVVDTPAVVSSITPSTLGPTNVTSLTYSVIFTKNVYDIVPSDFQLTSTGTAAGTVTSVSAASGSSFTVTVASVTGDGTLRLDLAGGSTPQDVAGVVVPGFTSGGITTFQHTPPAVVSSMPSTPGPTNATSLSFTVDFSETVYNVALGDFQLTTTGAAVGTLTGISALSGTSYTVDVASISGTGILRLDFEAGTTVQDAAGNLAAGYTSGGTVAVFTPLTVAAITPGLVSGVMTAMPESLAGGGFQPDRVGWRHRFQFPAPGRGTRRPAGHGRRHHHPADGGLQWHDHHVKHFGTGCGRLSPDRLRHHYRHVRQRELDGNQDGQPGSDWIRDFVVVLSNTTVFPAANPTMLSTGNTPIAMAAGDFNGDGVLDLVTVNQADGTLSVFIAKWGRGNCVRDDLQHRRCGSRCRGRGRLHGRRQARYRRGQPR